MTFPLIPSLVNLPNGVPVRVLCHPDPHVCPDGWRSRPEAVMWHDGGRSKGNKVYPMSELESMSIDHSGLSTKC